MGVEFGLANYPNVVDSCIAPMRAEVRHGTTASAYLFPLALQVPGVLHILDWAVRETVQTLKFWPAWQSASKRILQYTHGQNHRTLMQHLIAQWASDESRAAELASGLAVSTGRFAKWRWKTLRGAVRDMCRVECAFRFIVEHSSNLGSDLAMRDGTAAAAISAAVADDAVWDQSKVIGLVIEDIMELMSWVQGCDCHEEQLQQGQPARCNMKGCRARRFGSRIGTALSSIDSKRTAAMGQRFGSVDSVDVVHTLSCAMACLQSKLHWANELPYLVWQALLNSSSQQRSEFSALAQTALCCLV